MLKHSSSHDGLPWPTGWNPSWAFHHQAFPARVLTTVLAWLVLLSLVKMTGCSFSYLSPFAHALVFAQKGFLSQEFLFSLENAIQCALPCMHSSQTALLSLLPAPGSQSALLLHLYTMHPLEHSFVMLPRLRAPQSLCRASVITVVPVQSAEQDSRAGAEAT